jgi:proteic killer suppression protein
LTIEYREIYTELPLDVDFKDATLERLYTDPRFNGGFGETVVKAYRKRMQEIRAASDERTFYARRSLNFERLHRRPGQYSIRLNDQWRLIIELKGEAPKKTIYIVGIEDYH